jgi:hypothetical protein
MNTVLLLVVTGVWMVVSGDLCERMWHGHGIGWSQLPPFILYSSIVLSPVYLSIALANQGQLWTTASAVGVLLAYIAATCFGPWVP